MGVPLLVGSTVDPQQFPVESLAVRGYQQGVDTARLQPSIAGAIGQGVTAGVQQYQEGQATQARIRALDANAQANLQQAELDRQIQPLRVQAEQMQVMNQTLRANTEAKKANLALRREQDQLKDLALTTEAFNLVRNGDLETGLTTLERNFPALARSGISFTNDEKGSKIALDPGILAELEDLSEKAQATGDPRLQARAQSLVQKFQGAANRTTTAAGGKEITLTPGQEVPGPTDPIEGVLQETGTITPAGGQRSQPRPLAVGPAQGSAVSPVAAPAGTPQMSPTPAGTPRPIPTPEETQAQYNQALQELNFPEKPLPGAPSVDPAAVAAEEDKPVSQRFMEKAPLHFQQKVELQYKRIKQRSPQMEDKDAYKLAIDQASKSEFSVQQEETVGKVQVAAADYRTTSQRARTAFERLQGLMRKYPDTDPELGKTQTIPQILQQIGAKTGLSDTDKEILLNIKPELDAIGNLQAIQRIQELGLGTQAINTEEERAALRALSTGGDVSLERNLQALEILEAKSEELNDRAAIIETYRRFGHDYGAANDAAEQYRRGNPSTIVDKINGQSFVRRNPNKQNAYRFVDERLNLSRFKGRTKEGRLTTSQPTPVTPLASKLAKEVTEKNFTRANASDIPEKQPGGANEATIRRIISAESSLSNPDAESSAGAKGVMQLMDKTGKEAWEELGFDGPYDPLDREKNITMGIHYFNKMLVYFNNDTRLAAAAYNAGPGTISDAMLKAEKHRGDTSWAVVKQYLPPKATKETIPYVDKIMGDGGIQREKKTLTHEELPGVFASLPTVRAQNNARANLTQEGLRQLERVSRINTPDDAQGTPLQPILEMLVSANPFAATEAQAEEPGAGKPTPSPTASPAPAPTPAGGSEGAATAEQGMSLKDIPAALHSMIMGAGRTILVGSSDEFGALVRMAVLGEDWDTATQTTRAIEEEFKQAHPGFFLTGEIAGAVAQGGALAAGARAARGAQAAGEVAKAAPTVLKSVKTGAKAAAGYSAAQGFGEGEGGVGNRIKKAAASGVLGGVFGGLTSGTLQAGANVFNSGTVRIIVQKIYAKATGTGAPVEFSRAEAQLVKRLRGLSGDDFKEALANLKATDNEAASLIDELGDTKIRQMIDSISKDPDVTSKLQRVAGERLDTQTARLAGKLDDFTDDIPTESAVDDAAGHVEKSYQNLVEKRRAEGRHLYDEAERSLPDVRTGGSFGAKQAIPETRDVMISGEGQRGPGRQSFAPDRPPEPGLVNSKGETILTKDQLVNRYRQGANLPDRTPGFVSDEVMEAMTDPKVKEAINAAHAKVDPDRLLPSSSFEILQEAKAVLGSSIERVSGKNKKVTNEAFEKLRSAMYNESKPYEAADSAFRAASEKIDDLQTKAFEKLRKFADTGEVENVQKFGETLFKNDARTIKAVIDSVDDNGKQAFRNVARNHILDQLKKRGERKPDGTKTFPDFTKDKFQEKLQVIFGEDDGSKIMSELLRESRVSSTANTIIGQGSQTFTRTAEKLRSLDENSKGQLVNALTISGIGGGVAAAGNPVLGGAIALRGIYGVGQALKNKLQKGTITNEQQLSEELSQILVIDKKAGMDFLEKVGKQLTQEENSPVAKFWNKSVELARKNAGASTTAGRVAGQTAAAESDSFQPQTKKIKKKLRDRE